MRFFQSSELPGRELNIQSVLRPVIANAPTYPDPGLCRDCQHARRIESDRGSTFLMCKLSFEDSRFVKYPRLPVMVCSGYRPETENPAAEDA
jgi:hypothetical protein